MKAPGRVVKPELGRDVRRRRARVVAVLAVLGPAALAYACAPESELSGPGEECFAATDCQPGLVCVPQRGGSRLCTNDLSQITGVPPPSPPDGDASLAGDASGDGPILPDDSGTETGVTDTGVDTGPIVDAALDG